MSKKHKHKFNKAGLPPETAVYTGQTEVKQPIVTVVQYNDSVFSEKILRGDSLTPFSADKVTWYDVRGLSQVALIERLGQTFHVHPLAIEDILNTSQRPKWEDYENGIFIIVRALRLHHNEEDFITEQVSFYLEKQTLLSFQEDTDDLFFAVRERLERGQGKIRSRGTDFLAYALIDSIVDDYIHILDHLEDEIESIEVAILTNFSPSVRSRIYTLRRQLTEVRRAVLPFRDVVSRFSREESEFVYPANHVYTRDLYDHVIRAIETIENQRDMLNNLDSLYNSEQNNQTNHIFKVLTIISVIFIPPTFIAGIYGTNFDILPELHYKNAYFWMWAVIILIAIGQLVYFRWKKWL
ncbi:MAG: magnesium/cobalt transporter CorA [Saprospiraceae bacterium]|nr:magnesium/cobalt transporter CorA [Saprospiraceae bacterium]